MKILTNWEIQSCLFFLYFIYNWYWFSVKYFRIYVKYNLQFSRSTTIGVISSENSRPLHTMCQNLQEKTLWVNQYFSSFISYTLSMLYIFSIELLSGWNTGDIFHFLNSIFCFVPPWQFFLWILFFTSWIVSPFCQ